MPEKDTARLLSAGAQKVLWIKSKPRYLAVAIRRAMRELDQYRGILFEGNHALKYLDPDMAIMIRSTESRMKQSALEVLNKVDLFFHWELESELIQFILRRIYHSS
jgi:hypothetical protein